MAIQFSRKKLLEEAARLPSIILTERQYFDLALLLSGGFAPLNSFVDEEDYHSILENVRLKNGAVWPMPIVLDTSDSSLSVGQKFVLKDRYETPMALFEIASVYKSDKKKEAKAVYGTLDTAHPGVSYLFKEVGDFYLSGKLTKISEGQFPHGTRTPAELKKILPRGKVIAFQTRNPIHRAHFELLTSQAKNHKAHLLIHPTIGLTRPGDIDSKTRIRIYEHIVKRIIAKNGKGKVTLSFLPLAMRMAGPHEALWHALVRKNHGATHFIIGRDHAGPGNDSAGKPFHGPYDAQEFAKRFESKIAKISGTQFRNLLRSGGEIPEWFSFPEVIDELRKAEQKNMQKGLAVFLTGLSSAGKSTIAKILEEEIDRLNLPKKVTVLDGDVSRKYLSKGLGFSKEDRNTNVERLGYVASEIVRHGGIVIVAAIAPYREARNKNRELISKYGTYVEVFVDTSIKECVSRDVKGLYTKARIGLVKGVTGIDDPYEKPEKPEIHIKTKGKTPEASAGSILKYLEKNALL